MKKIKILRIIARLNIGGPAINAVLLTEGLNNAKFESLLVVGRISESEGDMSYLAHNKGIDPVVIPQLRREINLLDDFIAFCKIYRLIREFSPDIIHTHTAKAGMVGRTCALLFNLTHRKKIKLIHTFHGHVLNAYFNKLLTKFFILFERILAKFTDRIIVVSDTVKKDILSLGIGDNKKIQVVHLGFELEELLNIKQKEFGVLSVGIVGRLVPIKNHRMFLDAIKLLFEKRGMENEERFFIIGDGELRDELEGYAGELGITGKVEFLGWQNDLTDIYRNLDIVVLTSLNEGTPVSLIEALASERAVIATDVGGVRDIIGSKTYPEIADKGILVGSDDRKSFADGLKLLLEDTDLRHSLGVRGREFVRKQFNSKRLIKDTEMVYNMLFTD